MPILLEQTEIKLQRSDLARRRSLGKPVTPSPRSPGIHVSDVLRFISQTSGLTRYANDLIGVDEVPMRWFLGFAFEEAVASLYENWIWQPKEVIVDGVAMNCDGLNHVDGDGLMIEESKLTSKRPRHGDEFLAEWAWISQVKAYCHGYEARLARHHVCYYGGFSDPLYIRYVTSYTDDEIAKTWAMVQLNKEKAWEAMTK